jgi:hypothetical protein
VFAHVSATPTDEERAKKAIMEAKAAGASRDDFETRTAIVRNIFPSVGICDRNSIIFQHGAISSVIFWLNALTSSSPA